MCPLFLLYRGFLLSIALDNPFLSRYLKLCIFSSNVFAEESVLSSLRTSPLIKPFQTPGGVEMRILEFLGRFKMSVHLENILSQISHPYRRMYPVN